MTCGPEKGHFTPPKCINAFHVKLRASSCNINIKKHLLNILCAHDLSYDSKQYQIIFLEKYGINISPTSLLLLIQS
jgi:hypothetical protein